MNKEVTITGMEVKTHVGPSLLIQKSTLAGTAIEAESGFIKDETQTINAVLEPVSTVNGEDFFYTVAAKANGSILDDVAYTAYDVSTAATNTTTYGNKFSEDYEASKTFINTFVTDSTSVYRDKAFGYVDYVFQLKAANTDAEAKAINLTKLDLTYDGSTDGEKAYRAAVFVSDAIVAGATFDDWSSAIGETATIYCPESAENFTSGEAVDDVDSTDAVTYIGDDPTNDTAVAIATVPANSIKYYKVVVRLWIEGEDTTCNTSTFATLTEKWALDLEMQLGQGTGVTALGMETTPAGGNTTPDPNQG